MGVGVGVCVCVCGMCRWRGEGGVSQKTYIRVLARNPLP